MYHIFPKVLYVKDLTETALVVLKQLQYGPFLDHAGYNNHIRGLYNEGEFSLDFTILDDMLDIN
jgi:hypothetical protein